MDIDLAKYTLEEKDGQLIFTPTKPKMVKSWEELGVVSGWCLSVNSQIIDAATRKTSGDHKNVWVTKEQAEASLAMSQLSQLMKQANGDWVADWEEYQWKPVIKFRNGEVIPVYGQNYQSFLVFKTEEIRDEFLENHRDLIEQAKPLL